MFGLAERGWRERKRNPGTKDSGDSREDTRQASGFGVVACKTTERYLSVARFDPVGSDYYSFIVNPRKNRVLARGKRYKYFNKHSTESSAFPIKLASRSDYPFFDPSTSTSQRSNYIVLHDVAAALKSLSLALL